MIKKIKINLNLILKSALTTGLLILSTSSVSFAGHKNYFIRTSIDYSGFGILSEIINDDGVGESSGTSSSDSPYEEEKAG